MAQHPSDRRGQLRSRRPARTADMAWGQATPVGNGTTQQVEDAHAALDREGIMPGPLAVRVLALVGMVDRLRSESTSGGGCTAMRL